MSANSSPSPSAHRVGIVMSPAGRCLRCRDCKLSFDFPDGAQYHAIATQFGPHLCISPLRISGWQIRNSTPDRAAASSERRFVVLKFGKGKVPVLASCAYCQRKFFTPLSTFVGDAIGAEQYLATKFDLHRCEDTRRDK